METRRLFIHCIISHEKSEIVKNEERATRFSSLFVISVGIDHFIDTTTVHCMDENCNENFEKAWASIGVSSIKYDRSLLINTEGIDSRYRKLRRLRSFFENVKNKEKFKIFSGKQS